ncbi:hypothetical protein RvY_15949 [Ramazzottius varieornatus]|uniref:Aminotransferase class I/classII large domain-containing protein n=1 Tax=Ramazzottius varieornatus TaxID=947166 RepID=A0A1D1VWQ6_RAMVA|nr:hypothetical protein RvY_15949 [Ramazzottius varieornatus]
MPFDRTPILHEYNRLGDYNPDHYNFHIGAPHPSELILCSKIVEKAVASIAEQPASLRSSAFQYGYEFGADPVLDSLAGFLSSELNHEIKAENLMITAGSSLAFSMVCTRMFSHRGSKRPILFVEHPTYFLIIDSAQHHGFQVETIPTTAEGKIDFKKWEKLICELGLFNAVSTEEGTHRAMVYLVPTFRNPNGESLAKDDAHEVLSLITEHNMLLYSDDVYSILYFGNEPPQRIFPVGQSDLVISAGTFSKLLGPGLRVGWIESTPKVVERLSNTGFVVSGGCMAQFSSFIIERAIVNGSLSCHVKDLRRTYKEKAHAIKAAFESGLPEGVKWKVPQGGYFVWLILPANYSQTYITNVLVPEANKLNLRFGIGARSCPALKVGEPCELGCGRALRLSLGHVTANQIPKGIRQLCELLTL